MHIGLKRHLIHPLMILLKSKLLSYRIGGKTLKWTDSFLCFRQQRVVVNGVKTDWHRSWSVVVLSVRK